MSRMRSAGRWFRAFGELGMIVLLASGQLAFADDFNGMDLDIEYWTGTGSYQAVLVVDFKATGGDSYVFGYRWDGQATGYDMVNAVATGGGLDFTAKYWSGMGYYIVNYSYQGQSGNPDNYWCYWLGTPGSGTVGWVSAGGGPSSRVLSDGVFDGWYNGFDGTEPRLPEPMTGMLVLPLGLLVVRRRRMRAA